MAGVGDAMSFMMLFDIFVAVYMLYYAIRGEGKLYESGDFPKEMREEHNKMLRKFCWIVGTPLLVLSILEYLQGADSIWSTVSVIYVLTCVVVYVILFRRRFKQYLTPQKPVKQQSGAKSKKKQR